MGKRLIDILKHLFNFSKLVIGTYKIRIGDFTGLVKIILTLFFFKLSSFSPPYTYIKSHVTVNTCYFSKHKLGSHDKTK